MTNTVFPFPFPTRKAHVKFRYMGSVSLRNTEQVLKALVVPQCTGTTISRPQLQQEGGRMAVRSTVSSSMHREPLETHEDMNFLCPFNS